MDVILFDHPATRQNLLPFTFLRPVADIRVGILTIREKWEKMFPARYSYLTEPYLAKKYALQQSEQNLYVDGSILPDWELVQRLSQLQSGEALMQEDRIVAICTKIDSVEGLERIFLNKEIRKFEYSSAISRLNFVYDIFIKNEKAIHSDIQLVTKGRKSEAITDPHTVVYNVNNVFVEKNVTIKAAVLNAERGPIYIGQDAVIGEGSIIRGTTSICEGSVLNLGTRIRGDSTIGPYCKVGGEIANSVLFGFSSKAHDGYLGNSVIAEWCNLGADTNTSNLKNNYKNIKIWNYRVEDFVDAGIQFCGLMMGDHSKCGINTMFNTGTVVGVSANIFGSGFPTAYIPSFSWGGSHGFSIYQLEKALEVIPKVYNRRRRELKEHDIDILTHIFNTTHKNREEKE